MSRVLAVRESTVQGGLTASMRELLVANAAVGKVSGVHYWVFQGEESRVLEFVEGPTEAMVRHATHSMGVVVPTAEAMFRYFHDVEL